MNEQMTFILGAAIGAGAMYMPDPQRGNRRRAMVRDQVVSARNSMGDTATGLSKDAQNRAQGMMAEARNATRNDEVSDRVLEERVRSELGRHIRHAGAVTVRAHDGTVDLSGSILADDAPQAEKATRSVRGVLEVRNRLDVHRTPGNILSLQE